MREYDLIVVGSGQGGTALAVDAARDGSQVALIERRHLGGSCVNVGCTPSKAWLAAAHAVGQVRRAPQFGVKCEMTVDFGAVMDHVRGIRDQWQEGVNRTRDVRNLDVIDGEARFVGERKLAVGDEEFTARRIVINTGTSPVVPPIDGLRDSPYLTNETVFDLQELPARTAVVGGGYVGLELGQCLARCGSRVTLIESLERVMNKEAPRVSRVLQESLEEDGVDVRLETKLEAVQHDGRQFSLTLSDDGRQKLEVDALLVAIGQKPNTKALQADAAGVKLTDEGFIQVDDHLHTTADGIWAIGDVVKQPAFTHVSYEDYRRLQEIWRGVERTRDDRVLAYAVFTDPQVGRVGLSAEQAEAQGLDYRAERRDYKKIARAREWGDTRGFVEIVVDRKSKRMLGATVVGYEASELVQIFLPQIQHGLTWCDMAMSVFIHPTYGEGLRSLARQCEGD